MGRRGLGERAWTNGRRAASSPDWAATWVGAPVEARGPASALGCWPGAGHCPAESPVGVGAGTYWQWAEATLGSLGRAAEPGKPSRSLMHTIVMGERPAEAV